MSGLNAEKNKAIFLTNSKPLRGSRPVSKELTSVHCTDRNFVVISSQQVLHFDLEVTY